jgi:hypothetical protein
LRNRVRIECEHECENAKLKLVRNTQKAYSFSENVLTTYFKKNVKKIYEKMHSREKFRPEKLTILYHQAFIQKSNATINASLGQNF